MTHTPGPWVVVFSERNGAALRIEAPNDFNTPGGVGNIIRQNGIGMPACGVGHANARLIAASPDGFVAARAAYLALLRTPLASIERHRIHSVLCQLRDYLAKATGTTAEEIQTALEAEAAP